MKGFYTRCSVRSNRPMIVHAARGGRCHCAEALYLLSTPMPWPCVVSNVLVSPSLPAFPHEQVILFPLLELIRKSGCLRGTLHVSIRRWGCATLSRVWRDNEGGGWRGNILRCRQVARIFAVVATLPVMNKGQQHTNLFDASSDSWLVRC